MGKGKGRKSLGQKVMRARGCRPLGMLGIWGFTLSSSKAGSREATRLSLHFRRSLLVAVLRLECGAERLETGGCYTHK